MVEPEVMLVTEAPAALQMVMVAMVEMQETVAAPTAALVVLAEWQAKPLKMAHLLAAMEELVVLAAMEEPAGQLMEDLTVLLDYQAMEE